MQIFGLLSFLVFAGDDQEVRFVRDFQITFCKAGVLRVEGHTDDLQLKPGSAFRTNWQLAAERATVVTEFLRAQRLPATV